MKKKPEEHGTVLKPSHLDYTGMQKIGRIVITEDSDKRWGVQIEVSGFKFDRRTPAAPM